MHAVVVVVIPICHNAAAVAQHTHIGVLLVVVNKVFWFSHANFAHTAYAASSAGEEWNRGVMEGERVVTWQGVFVWELVCKQVMLLLRTFLEGK